jgi:hypothetical protein
MSADFEPLDGADQIAVFNKWFMPDGVTPDRDKVYREYNAGRLPAKKWRGSRILRTTGDALRRAYDPAL